MAMMRSLRTVHMTVYSMSGDRPPSGHLPGESDDDVGCDVEEVAEQHDLVSVPPAALLLGDRLAGAAQLFWEVLELGEAIFHAQHGRLVVDVHLGCKRKCRDRRRVDVDQTPLRVPRQQMAAADLAPLPIALLVLVVLVDLVFSLGHLDRLGLPERECVDRAGGPAPTGGAMAVASTLRIARNDNRDSAAEALAFEALFILAHEFSLRSRSRRDIARAVSLRLRSRRERLAPTGRRLRELRLALETSGAE